MEEQQANDIQGHPSSASSSVAQTNLERGRLFYQQNKLNEALSLLHAAYDQYAQGMDQGHMAEVANDIGVVCTVLQQWKEAEQWLGQAHERFTVMSDYSGEAQALGNLGSMYRARGDLRQAAAYFQLAADRFHLVGDDERRAATLKALSIVCLSQFRFLQALAAYDAALACEPHPTLWQKLLRAVISAPLRMIGG